MFHDLSDVLDRDSDALIVFSALVRATVRRRKLVTSFVLATEPLFRQDLEREIEREGYRYDPRRDTTEVPHPDSFERGVEVLVGVGLLISDVSFGVNLNTITRHVPGAIVIPGEVHSYKVTPPMAKLIRSIASSIYDIDLPGS